MLAQKPTPYLWRAQARQRGGERAVTSQSTLGGEGGAGGAGREEPRTKRGRVTPRTRIIFTYISSASST